MTITEKIQAMREKTGLGILDLKKALEASNGDEEGALAYLKEKGIKVAEKRAERATGQGVVVSYVHAGRIGALLALNCETDFVALTDDFKDLARDLAMQVASMAPEDVESFLKQDFIKDPSKTIEDLVTAMIAKTGENIRIGKFSRIALSA